VRAILDNLIEIHRLNRKEVRQMSAAIGTHMSALNDLFVDRIISIMQAIHQETAVEFHYYKVAEGAISKSDDSVVYRCVYPLQIRVFEGRYYLVGLREGREAVSCEVEHFPIDRIHRRVDLAVDEESGDFKTFLWEDLAAKVALE
jgi:predicted DNA-binding transcriptional regulator YafY